MGFLRREIRQDSRGLFVYYGGCRIRPYLPEKTKFNLADVVSMTRRWGDQVREGERVRVFRNTGCYYETWMRGRKDS